VRGDVSDAVADLHRLVLEAHERSLAMTRPGVPGVDVYGAACDVFEAAGYPTQRTKKPGEALQHGFFFSLGHGVGLEVHEAPMLGRTGQAALVDGDVVAVEPGVVDPEHGGMRVEDLVLVTAQGYEQLTERSYDLVP
jgi:Xaa-Pro aminopeptidase